MTMNRHVNVDDDPDEKDLIQEALSKIYLKCNIFYFSNGLELITFLSQDSGKVDLIILD
jgi:DNA-binding response OmpR family regulator